MLQIVPGLLTTGEVPRITEFEEVGIPLKTLTDGRIVQDLMGDDIAVIAQARETGIFIITGCSHGIKFWK